MPFIRRAPASAAPAPVDAGAGPSTSSSSSSSPSLAPDTSSAAPSPSPPAPFRVFPSGLPSLDDLFPPALPAGHVLVVLAPDAHTAWARVVARHWAAQGLLADHRAGPGGGRGERGQTDRVERGVVFAEPAWVAAAPWVEGNDAHAHAHAAESEGEGEAGADDEADGGRARIAWRYDKMGRFRTTVETSAGLAANTTVPPPVLRAAEDSGRITYHPPTSFASSTSSAPASSAMTASARALADAYDLIDAQTRHGRSRVTVPDLGSYEWGAPSAFEIVRFLVRLRALVRARDVGVLVTLPPHLSPSPSSSSYSSSTSSSSFPSSSPAWSSTPLLPADWTTRLAWASDACLTLTGFGSSPSLVPAFAPLHGLLDLHSFPHAAYLAPPSVRHSALLGLAAGGAGNNLGFRMRRKRWAVETVHLGIEGGTGERRTAPGGGALEGMDKGAHAHPHAHEADHRHAHGADHGHAHAAEGVERARVGVEHDGAEPTHGAESGAGAHAVKRKPRAKVRFGEPKDSAPEAAPARTRETQPPRVVVRHDRPELYEF
ncbi:Elongator subunit elp4 [Cryptotrichosporon argae]